MHQTTMKRIAGEPHVRASAGHGVTLRVRIELDRSLLARRANICAAFEDSKVLAKARFLGQQNSRDSKDGFQN